MASTDVPSSSRPSRRSTLRQLIEQTLPNLLDKAATQDGILAPSDVDTLAEGTARLLDYIADLEQEGNDH